MTSFYDRDLGHFWSSRTDLSDLGDEYLAAAQRQLALRKSWAQTPRLGAVPDTSKPTKQHTDRQKELE